ncbi:MAG: hypothetical protein U0V87_16930 [Acidobacteriota bacterium]
MNGKSKLFLAALAGALALPSLALAEDAKPGTDKDAGKVPCWGINKCKGVGDCGADGCRHSGCHGSNGCNGSGFIRLEAETCLKIVGGRLTKAAEPAKVEKKGKDKK